MSMKKIITIRNKLHKYIQNVQYCVSVNPFYTTFAAETD